jgi:tetratricopeptide (TPR) repeat protein
MTRIKIFGWLVVYALAATFATRAYAENEGQADLDKATELRVTAESLSDLEKVTELCESALQKGLDEANEKFARQLLSSTLFQHATQLCAPVFDQTPPDRRWPLLRQFALRDLEKTVELNPEFAEAHLLIARLHALPGGDSVRGSKAASAVISLSDKDNQQKAAALVLRGQFREDNEKRLLDYGAAVELDPSNVEAWQGRALTYMDQGDFDKAIEDFNAILKQNEENVDARLALAEALTNLERYDDAWEQVDKALKLRPDSSLAYTLRARLYVLREDIKAALADLDQALRLQPSDLAALLIRARLYQTEGNLAAAESDVQRVLQLSPGLPQGLLIRSMILADKGRLGEAIADMKSVLQQDPKSIAWRLQLGGYYLQDRRPTKAIDLFTEVLADEEDNWVARQARADTLLSVGKHAEAIADFEIVLKQQPEDDGILNNFAWVLATSPDDQLRNGKRAIELATKACELTDYKKPHILSTLAAAYAEVGDFETAVKWSRRAVELGDKTEEVDQQLKQELESYLQKKPWRERQTVEEKEDPVQPGPSRFEA